MKKLTTALWLAGTFVVQMVLSGVATLRLIVAPQDQVRPMLVTYPFAPMSEAGAALLAGLVTLTPGTTVVDIDMDARNLLLHVLDGRDETAAVEGIRRHFERHVQVLCGVSR